MALALAYWRAGIARQGERLNPAADGCGLTWYSPLVPMTARPSDDMSRWSAPSAPGTAIEPLITLTSLSDRCFDSSVPLLFDRRDAARHERAQACYRGCSKPAKQGFVPYRVGVQAMDWLVRRGLPCWDMVAAIKSAIDPRGIISPGRYGP